MVLRSFSFSQGKKIQKIMNPESRTLNHHQPSTIDHRPSTINHPGQASSASAHAPPCPTVVSRTLYIGELFLAQKYLYEMDIIKIFPLVQIAVGIYLRASHTRGSRATTSRPPCRAPCSAGFRAPCSTDCPPV